jgi:hypothetical protein
VGREVKHSHLSSAKVKNKWNYTFNTLVCLQSVKKEDFTLLTLNEGLECAAVFSASLNLSILNTDTNTDIFVSCNWVHTRWQ